MALGVMRDRIKLREFIRNHAPASVEERAAFDEYRDGSPTYNMRGTSQRGIRELKRQRHG